MRRLGAILTASALLGASPWAFAGDHLLTPAATQERLAQAERQREQDTQAVEQVLSRPEAASVAAALGTSVERVQRAVPTLNPGELHDLAARATLLGQDPVAGDEFHVHDFLVVFLVVAIVVLVLGAVNS